LETVAGTQSVEPPGPVQVKPYIDGNDEGVTSTPTALFVAPLVENPEPVHDVALLVLHFRVDDSPGLILLGVAVKLLQIGAGGRFTVIVTLSPQLFP
jgi:hypothetical protein